MNFDALRGVKVVKILSYFVAAVPSRLIYQTLDEYSYSTNMYFKAESLTGMLMQLFVKPFHFKN